MSLAPLGPSGPRLRVEHVSRFRYESTVSASYNECRLLPTSDARQQVLSARVSVEPVTWRREYVDYWGTRVVGFEVHTEHDELEVVGAVDAVVAPAGTPPDAGWDAVRDPAVRDRWCEFLVATQRSRPSEELAALAQDAAAGLAPSVAAQAVCQLVSDRLTYRPGSTGVHTLAMEAWDAQSGVCQDFAQLAVGALRSVGLPARYVSGYLHPKADAEIGQTERGESHAWVEWWAGEWYGWDPTNVKPAGHQHIVTGRGRDYGDVPPVRGILAGGGAAQLTVQVSVTTLS
ncbi:transglutaminase family protein [Angustibacter luteus]|uniref:Transglutaminase family protein n=1 Tax=Angustibacter luteus TaxID=658456 RepID=A0ABW1JKA2_9ACTN